MSRGCFSRVLATRPVLRSLDCVRNTDFFANRAVSGSRFRLSSHSNCITLAVRCCASASNELSFLEKMKSRYQGPAPPMPHIVRLDKPARMYSDPGVDVDAEVATELPDGELVETFADLEESTEWVLVRAPLEDHVDVMSDKPLEYQDGWLHNPSMQLAEYQVGQKVNAIVDVPSHPLLETLRLIPMWKKAPVPQRLQDSVCEFHAGKIAGVVKRGRFLVQRPSGAIPERIATGADKLIVPRQRWRRIVLAGLVGMVGASCFGCALHGWAWFSGTSMYGGRQAWPNVVGWLTIVVVFLTPLTTYPCYLFQISQLSTASAIVWVNMLFYSDLFNE